MTETLTDSARALRSAAIMAAITERAEQARLRRALWPAAA